MIVIADMSPISYLVLIDAVDLLPPLYGHILIPTAVHKELTASQAPVKVRAWCNEPPSWLEIREISDKVDPNLSEILDSGESEAIQLAKELDADLLLIDELAGRKIAVDNGPRVVGLVGVLATAARRGLIDVEEAILRIETTNFYISEDLIEFLRKSSK